MAQAEEKEWKALAQVANSPQGQPVLDWLRRQREQRRDKLEETQDHAQLIRLQGEIAAYRELIDSIERAPDVVHSRFNKQ